MSNNAEFQKVVDESVEGFGRSSICKRLDKGDFTMQDYHKILLMIFHQTFEGPSTFALAGAHTPPEFHEARDYLLHHADEEKSHWQWVIGDLKNTGYTGPDPRQLFAKPACQAYVAFNVYTAMRQPLARLAIAVVLESIGASYGKKYATQICEILQLKPNQVVFFYGHGDTDVGHTQDLYDIIAKCHLSESQWKWMCHAARMAGVLYTNMYEEALA